MQVAGLIATIPNCVLGGMTTFLFASVTISGSLRSLFTHASISTLCARIAFNCHDQETRSGRGAVSATWQLC